MNNGEHGDRSEDNGHNGYPCPFVRAFPGRPARRNLTEKTVASRVCLRGLGPLRHPLRFAHHVCPAFRESVARQILRPDVIQPQIGPPEF